MGTLESLLLGFSVALQPDVLWYAFLGCLVGTIVGVLPGIGPLSGISILLPATFGLDTTKSVVMLAGIYYGSQYGGSTTSILMRIPGEASSVMTCIDGYAMAQKGRAGAALCIAAVGSWIAGTFGVLMLTLILLASLKPAPEKYRSAKPAVAVVLLESARIWATVCVPDPCPISAAPATTRRPRRARSWRCS